MVAHAITSRDRQTRSYGAMTTDLLELKQWLLDLEVTRVATEGAGVYCKPICNTKKDSF